MYLLSAFSERVALVFLLSSARSLEYTTEIRASLLSAPTLLHPSFCKLLSDFLSFFFMHGNEPLGWLWLSYIFDGFFF